MRSPSIHCALLYIRRRRRCAVRVSVALSPALSRTISLWHRLIHDVAAINSRDRRCDGASAAFRRVPPPVASKRHSADLIFQLNIERPRTTWERQNGSRGSVSSPLDGRPPGCALLSGNHGVKWKLNREHIDCWTTLWSRQWYGNRIAILKVNEPSWRVNYYDRWQVGLLLYSAFIVSTPLV